jgi:hypothetical protein
MLLEKAGEDRWTDGVRNEEILCRVKEEKNMLRTAKRRKANWIGPILRRSWLLKHVIERKDRGKDGLD